MKVDHGNRQQPSPPTNVPPPTTPPAYKDPHFPAIQENHFEILDSKMINSMLLVCSIVFDMETVMLCGVSVKGHFLIPDMKASYNTTPSGLETSCTLE